MCKLNCSGGCIECAPEDHFLEMKVSELSDRKLDWAVCEAEGYNPVMNPKRFGSVSYGAFESELGYSIKKYSTDWAQGGPIIEREGINVSRAALGGWVSTLFDDTAELLENSFKFRQYGPTPLLAAMRCYVASKLGDTVKIPFELTEEK